MSHVAWAGWALGGRRAGACRNHWPSGHFQRIILTNDTRTYLDGDRVKLSYLAVILLPLLGVAALSQTTKKSAKAPAKAPAVGSPEWVVREYFVDPNPPSLLPYMSSDFGTKFGDTTFGASVPSGVVVTYRSLQADSASRIYAVTARYGTDVRDMYCYLELQGTAWKIAAIHWLPAYDTYADDIKAIKATTAMTDSLQLELTMKELTISSDSALTRHFLSHKKVFDSLAKITSTYKGLFLLLTRCSDSGFAPEQGGVYAKVCPLMHAASVWGIMHGTQDCPAGTFFDVGEMRENMVGFLYVPQGTPVPKMSSDHIYLIDKIAPNWYLYKMG